MNVRNTPGWEPSSARARGEVVVNKRKNNAFAGTPLGALVAPAAEIVVAGLTNRLQRSASTQRALPHSHVRGNEVLLIRGAHATYDRIEVLHGGGVTPAFRIEAEIEAELEEAGCTYTRDERCSGYFDGSLGRCNVDV